MKTALTGLPCLLSVYARGRWNAPAELDIHYAQTTATSRSASSSSLAYYLVMADERLLCVQPFDTVQDFIHYVAQMIGQFPKLTGGDCDIYDNHREQKIEEKYYKPRHVWASIQYQNAKARPASLRDSRPDCAAVSIRASGLALTLCARERADPRDRAPPLAHR